MPNIRMLSARREMLEKEKLKHQGTVRARRDQEMDTQDVAKKTNTSETARAMKKAQRDANMAAAEEKIAEKKIANALLGQAIGALGAVVGFATTVVKLVKNSKKSDDPDDPDKNVPDETNNNSDDNKTNDKSFLGKILDAIKNLFKSDDKKDKTDETDDPDVKTPDVKTPDVKTPDVKTPAEKTPAEKTPDEKTPDVKTPAEKTPAEETPAPENGVKENEDAQNPRIKTDEQKQAEAAAEKKFSDQVEGFEKLFQQLLSVGGVDAADNGYKSKKKEGLGKAFDGFKDGLEGKTNNNFSERRDAIKSVTDKVKLQSIDPKNTNFKDLSKEQQQLIKDKGIRVGADGKINEGDLKEASKITPQDIARLEKTGALKEMKNGKETGANINLTLQDGKLVGGEDFNNLMGQKNELNAAIRDGKEGRVAAQNNADQVEKRNEALGGVNKAIESAEGDLALAQQYSDVEKASSDVDRASSLQDGDINKPENADLKQRLTDLGLVDQSGKINQEALSAKKSELSDKKSELSSRFSGQSSSEALTRASNVLSGLNMFKAEKIREIDSESDALIEGKAGNDKFGISFKVESGIFNSVKGMIKGAGNMIDGLKEPGSNKDGRELEAFMKGKGFEKNEVASMVNKLEGKASLTDLSNKTGMSEAQLEKYFDFGPNGAVSLKNGKDGMINQALKLLDKGSNLSDDITSGNLLTKDEKEGLSTDQIKQASINKATKLLNAMENTPGMSGLAGGVLDRLDKGTRDAILNNKDQSILSNADVKKVLGTDGKIDMGKLNALKTSNPESYKRVLQTLGVNEQDVSLDSNVASVLGTDGKIDMTKLSDLKASDPAKYDQVLKTLGVDPKNLNDKLPTQDSLNTGLQNLNKKIEDRVNAGLNTLNTNEVAMAMANSGISNKRSGEILGSRGDKDDINNKIGGAKGQTGHGERASTMNMIILGLNASMPAIQFYLQQLDKMREAQDQLNEAKKKKAAANELLGKLVKELKRTQGAINETTGAGSIGGGQ